MIDRSKLFRFIHERMLPLSRKENHSYSAPLAAGLVAFAVLGFSGCAGNGNGTGGGGVLPEAQVETVKKTAKTPQDLRTAVRDKVLADEGVAVPAKPTAKVKRRNR